MLIKKSSDKINVTKMHSFFFRELQLITVLLLIRNSFTSLSLWFIFSKLCRGIFRFVVILVFIKLTFLFKKNDDSWTLKRHNFFQKKNNGKVNHSFAARPMVFKLQQEVWKFIDAWMSWSSPKTDLETNFSNF